jgi:hypothetical protein
MHMWRHVTNHLIISNDKDSNSENRIKLRVRDITPLLKGRRPRWCHGSAGTPLGTHAGREALGLQDARTAIRT